MNNFNLHTPTRILFGKGAIAGLREQIPHDARVLITYGGGSVKKTGVLDQVLDALIRKISIRGTFCKRAVKRLKAPSRWAVC